MMINRTKSNIKFVGLHAHSVAGSPFDALGYPQEHMDFCYQNGMDAMALTDHGNCNGLSYQVLHAKKMNEEGRIFKPIYGVEAFYIDSLAEWSDYKQEYEKEHKKVKKQEKAGILQSGTDYFKESKSILNRRDHLLLLVQNKIGLRNLFKLVSLSHSESNFYRYPRMDAANLKKYSEGLIAGSACLGGVLSRAYRENYDEEEPLKSHAKIIEAMSMAVQKMIDIFGKDKYFIELQWNKIQAQHKLNEYLIEMSKTFGLKMITTIDSHYYNPSVWKDREMYKRLGWVSKNGKEKPAYLSDEIPDSIEQMDYDLYPKNGDQTWESYKKYSRECGYSYDDDLIMESIHNTTVINDTMIEEFYPDNEVILPDFVVPEGETEEHALTRLSIQGLKKLGLDKNKEYVARLKRELKVIKERKFSKYFLTMKMIADKAKEKQLTGPARGSAAGALSSYCLGITSVDPIRWGLLFERFLSKDSKDYPDIDFDCSNPPEIKDDLVREYGNDVFVPISNFNTLQLRSLIKDISKFYDVPFAEVNNVTNKMMYEATPKAKEANGIVAGVYTPTFEELLLYSDTLKTFLKKYPEIDNHVKILYGQIRSRSRHAAGLIASKNLTERMPLIQSGKTIQTPWTEGQNVRHLEPMGFIKFDLLGLASLRMLENSIERVLQSKHGIQNPTFEQVRTWYKENLHPDKIDFSDQNVYKNIFHEERWVGIFQFTENGAQNFCSSAKPTSLDDLSLITATYRPGPLSSGVHKMYLKAKEDPENIKYIHPIVKEVLGKNLGFIIYQEDLAFLANKLGKNINLDEGNKLRKLLIKKGIGEVEKQTQKIEKKFIEGCLEKEIKLEEAQDLWNSMKSFAKYGFNRCLSEETIVETNKGRKKIKDVNSSEYVKSKKGFVKVKQLLYQGKQKVVKIKTKNGKEIISTLNHKYETEFGMKTLEKVLKKGYELLCDFNSLEKITKIEYLEVEQETYDLEVESEEHTFFANGISVSNSHSISYCMLSYICAHMLNYYPIEWCCAFLDKEPEEKKEKAISIVKKLGFRIEPPQLNNSSEKYEILNSNTILQPFTSIKGLGEKAILEIINNRPYQTIEEFIFSEKIKYNKLNKKSLDVLIKSKVLNPLMDKRFNHLRHFWASIVYGGRPKTPAELAKNIQKYEKVRDFTQTELIKHNVEMLGVYPVEEIVGKELIAKIEAENIPPISQYDSETKVCWFIVKSVAIKKTQKGKDYLLISVSDHQGYATTVKAWSSGKREKERISINRPYLATLDYNSFGFSVRNIRQNFVMLG